MNLLPLLIASLLLLVILVVLVFYLFRPSTPKRRIKQSLKRLRENVIDEPSDE